MRIAEMAEMVGARLVRDTGEEITGVSSIASAGSEHLVFVQDAKYLEAALTSKAGALLAGEFASEAVAGARMSVVIAQNPRLAFAQIAAELLRTQRKSVGVHPTAVVDASVEFGEGVSVGALSAIGARVKVGARTIIGAGCVIADDVEIGDDCELVVRVTIYSHTRIGNRTTVHAGAVLGSDGFGFVPDPQTGRFYKFPQIGRLEIGDDVEIGANVTIDRGALDATVISNGVKLDNMVQVGHNAKLGENVVVAAQTGISGSSVLEKNVLVGGQVGIADHVTIEEGAILGAQAGIPSNKVIRGKGVVFWGTPARPIKDVLRELAAVARLARRKKKEE
jgi:UDP-3-O-[3-hydroxymyristoyl] glucosamine N-acyltransferase